MMPAVPVPQGAGIRSPVEVKLKTGWRYDGARRAFTHDSGESFKPAGELPKRSRIVYKVPALVEADPAGLSKDERDLARYMQVILPLGESPADYLDAIRAWPSVAEATLPPDISLPGAM